MLASVSRTARLGDQLQLDAEVNSEIADGYATGSSARRGVASGRRFANFDRQRAPAGPRIGVFRANGPRTAYVSAHKYIQSQHTKRFRRRVSTATRGEQSTSGSGDGAVSPLLQPCSQSGFFLYIIGRMVALVRKEGRTEGVSEVLLSL